MTIGDVQGLWLRSRILGQAGVSVLLSALYIVQDSGALLENGQVSLSTFLHRLLQNA